MRHAACTFFVAVMFSSAVVAEDAAKTWSFEDSAVGKLPKGWSAEKTGKGPGSVWKVLEDETAPNGSKILAQTSSEGPNPLFNLCVADDTSYQDVDLTVSFKARSGKLDRGGGLVWRYADADNYYVARCNPLESNYRVYKVVKGKRMQLQSAEVKVPSGEWHKLRVVQQGERIRCYLDGKLQLDVNDATFKSSGKIGLWSKADAVTSFDNLRASPPKDAD